VMDLEEAKRKHNEPLSDYHSYQDCIVCWLIPEVEWLKVDRNVAVALWEKVLDERDQYRKALEELRDHVHSAASPVEYVTMVAEEALKGDK